jgi:hypothetical protein
MLAGASDSERTENDRGTGPATSVSPVLSANENQKEDDYQPFASGKLKMATSELTRPDLLAAEPTSAEDEGSPEFEILKIFRRRIAGLRRLPHHQRARAIRAALEWLWSTLAALREKRAYARHRRHMLWQMKRIRPLDLDHH